MLTKSLKRLLCFLWVSIDPLLQPNSNHTPSLATFALPILRIRKHLLSPFFFVPWWTLLSQINCYKKRLPKISQAPIQLSTKAIEWFLRIKSRLNCTVLRPIINFQKKKGNLATSYKAKLRSKKKRKERTWKGGWEEWRAGEAYLKWGGLMKYVNKNNSETMSMDQAN